MPYIVLSTLNARYIHSAFGLRYLKANLGGHEDDCEIIEFTIHERPIDIAEKLLLKKPKIIGLGVYIWNIEETTKIVSIIKQVSPETIIVIGGPEVSFEQQHQTICQNADYVISGTGEKSFRQLCEKILNNKVVADKFIPQQTVNLSEIKFPYHLYNDEDIAHRIIYVEASRGCPFKCEFCLSALDKTAWPFDLDLFLEQLKSLYDRGVRHFKFVDRTFNLKIDNTIRILDFFLDHMDEKLFLHFELIPDHLPERLKQTIKKFPPHSLQFEIGVQSFNPQTQTLVSRRQDDKKTEQNLHWIRNSTNAHIHADLIIGLPGEDINSFAVGLNRLIKLNPHEIQIGILKRLRGSPIIRHSDEFKLRFNPAPPYNILSNNLIDFAEMQRLGRFARYWDMIINSGRFSNTKNIIFADQPFQRFITLSDWLFATTDQTHKISLKRLFELLFDGLCNQLACDKTEVSQSLLKDFHSSGLKGSPSFQNKTINKKDQPKLKAANRQKRHA